MGSQTCRQREMWTDHPLERGIIRGSRNRKKERHGERERDRETERETQTDRQTDRDKHRVRQSETVAPGLTNRYRNKLFPLTKIQRLPGIVYFNMIVRCRELEMK